MKWFLIFVVLGIDGEPLQTRYPMNSGSDCFTAEEASERLLIATRQGRNAVIVECVARQSPK